MGREVSTYELTRGNFYPGEFDRNIHNCSCFSFADSIFHQEMFRLNWHDPA